MKEINLKTNNELSFLKKKQDDLYFKYKKIIYDDLSNKEQNSFLNIVFYVGLACFILWTTMVFVFNIISFILLFISLLFFFNLLNKKSLRTKKNILDLFNKEYNQIFFKNLQINEKEKMFFKKHFEENKHKTMEVAGVKDYVFGLNLVRECSMDFIYKIKEEDLLNSAKNKIIADKIRYSILKKCN